MSHWLSLKHSQGSEMSKDKLKGHNSVMLKLLLLPLPAYNYLHGLGYVVVVVVALLFYIHSKHLRSCRDSQLA